MISASMYFVFLCLSIFNYQVFGFNIKRNLHEDESDSLHDKQQEVLIRRQYWPDIPNINYGYTTDSFNAYYMGRKIDGASVHSFKPLGGGYAKDTWNAYFAGQKISGARANSFQSSGYGYAKDT
jgi:hypothetical protein